MSRAKIGGENGNCGGMACTGQVSERLLLQNVSAPFN